jgi:hypothetical protein
MMAKIAATALFVFAAVCTAALWVDPMGNHQMSRRARRFYLAGARLGFIGAIILWRYL